MSASLPASITTFLRPIGEPMTWEAIMRDRIERGLEGEATVIMRAVKAPKAPKAVKAPVGPKAVTVAGELIDARDPRNGTPCTTPTGGALTTAAKASKARKLAMLACSCRRCALATFPPLTFAQYAAFGLDSIGAESETTIYGGPRIKREHECGSNQDRDTYRATVARELSHGGVFGAKWEGGNAENYMDLGHDGSIASTKRFPSTGGK